MTEREAAAEAAKSPAYRDGLSAGYAGTNRKPARQFHTRAGQWYDGYDAGAQLRANAEAA